MKRYLLVLLFILCIVWSILVYFNVFSVIDNIVYNFIISFKNNNVTNVMKCITFLASTEFIIGISIVIFCLFMIKKDKRLLILNIFAIGCTLINLLIKTIVRRPRPSCLNWLVEELYFSFPSGHSMIAMTFYGMIMYYLDKSKLNKKYRIVLDTILIVLIICIGLSRVYLGVHYFSDVLGGFLWSILIILLGIKYMERVKWL